MRVNVTVKDVSPLIAYAGPGGSASDWGDSTITDGCRESYLNGSMHGTPTAGATATFSFNGTGIWIFGAKRANHGNYIVQLDNTTSTYSGLGNELPGCLPTAFQQLLYGASNLTMGPHTLTLTNDPVIDTTDIWVDVDYMIFETAIGPDSQTVPAVDYDDTSSSFNYTPAASDWSLTPTAGAGLADYSFGTMHMAIDSQAICDFEFQGDAISVYGGVNTDYGSFKASMDSGYASLYNASSQWFYAGALLYHANSLGSGTHRLALANGDLRFDIDYAYVWSTGNSTTPPSSASSPSSSSGSHSSLAAGVIGGIIGGVVVALLIFIVGLIFLLRHRRQKKKEKVRESMDYIDPAAIPTPFTGSDVPMNGWSSHQSPPITSSTHTPSLYTSASYRYTTGTSVVGREQDAGHILGSETDEYMETLPPDYDQASVGRRPSELDRSGRQRSKFNVRVEPQPIREQDGTDS